MTRSIKRLATVFAISLLLTMLYGCQKPEGPAQKAGKAIDQGVAKTGEQIEKAGDSLQNGAKGNP
ncbi:MAG: hypothetical protein WCA24_10855 [Thiomonas sp.]